MLLRYMQGPIRTMLLEDLNKMGVVANSNINKRRSKAGAATSQVADKYQVCCTNISNFSISPSRTITLSL